ncbi:MAG: AI-2E family transporter [Nitrospinota bacterium]
MDKSIETKIQTVALLIISTILLGVAIKWLKPLLAPFVLSLLFALGLTPFIDFLKDRLKLSHNLALIATIITGFMLVTGFGLMIGISVAGMLENSELYQKQLLKIFEATKSYLPDKIFSLNLSANYESMLKIPLSTAGTLTANFASELLNFISNGFLVLLFTVFLLISQKDSNSIENSTILETKQKIQKYLLIKSAVSIVTGLAHGIVLYILGVKFAFMFGVLAALLNFIPTFGPFVAIALPIPIFLVSPELTILTAILAIVLPTIIHFVSGNIAEPAIFGKMLELTPIVTLLALILFGMIWGFVGMFLSIPLVVALKIILEKNEYTAFVSRLLAGKLG